MLAPSPAPCSILSSPAVRHKREAAPLPRPLPPRRVPPRTAPLPDEPNPWVDVIALVGGFYDSDKVRGQVCSFNITTLATLAHADYQAALDVVLVFHTFDLCKFDHPPHGLVFIKPEHREAFSFLEQEDLLQIANLMGEAAEGRAYWQTGGDA